MTLTVTETKTVDRGKFAAASVDERTMLLYDFTDQRFTDIESKLDILLSKNGNGDCISVKVGKGSLKIPISPETMCKVKRVSKVLACGGLLILMFTGQINVDSPLFRDLLMGIAKIFVGG
jgi:hypothetical protein